jgi:hypothetical protein
MNYEELYRITLDYACGAIIIKNDKVIRTAPIFNWMKWKTLDEIIIWVKDKKGTIEKVNNKT